MKPGMNFANLFPKAELCPALRWKGQFIDAPKQPGTSDGIVWCQYTQTCIGPDNLPADRERCTQPNRACYGTGKC